MREGGAEGGGCAMPFTMMGRLIMRPPGVCCHLLGSALCMPQGMQVGARTPNWMHAPMPYIPWSLAMIPSATATILRCARVIQELFQPGRLRGWRAPLQWGQPAPTCWFLMFAPPMHCCTILRASPGSSACATRTIWMASSWLGAMTRTCGQGGAHIIYRRQTTSISLA